MRSLFRQPLRLFILALLCGVPVCSAQTWSRAYYDLRYTAPRSSQYSLHPQSLSDGGYIGVFQGTVVRFAADGGIIWQRHYSGPEYNYGFANVLAIPYADGFLVVGEINLWYYNYVVIFRLDSGGNPLWKKFYSIQYGDFQWVQSILETADGGFIMGGTTTPYEGYRPDSEHQGDWDEYRNAWLMKVNPQGGVQWKRYVDVDSVWRILQTADSGYLFSTIGGSIVKLRANGSFQWQKKYGTNGGAIDSYPGGGYFLAVGTNKDPTQDITILRLDDNGNILWQKKLVSRGGEYFFTLHYISGILYAGGVQSPSYRTEAAILYALKSNGDVLWRKQYGNFAQQHQIASIAAAPGGGLVLLALPGWILKTDSQGSLDQECRSDVVSPTRTNSTSNNIAPQSRKPAILVPGSHSSNGTPAVEAGRLTEVGLCSPVILGSLSAGDSSENIRGVNFGRTQGQSRLTVDGVDVQIKSWTAQEITADFSNVQPGAIVRVIVNGISSNAVTVQ